MEYRNIKTGNIVNIKGVAKGKNWELIAKKAKGYIEKEKAKVKKNEGDGK